MARKTKEEKRIEAAVEAAFKRHSPGNPISVFDIGKVMTAGTNAALAGGDDAAIDTAVKAAFDLYAK